MPEFVTVEGRTLKQAMKLMNAVIERRNTHPILGCVKLAHSTDGLTLTGTDLDREIVTTIDVIDGGGGTWEICIDASTLTGIASAAGVMPMKIERRVEKREEMTDQIKALVTLGDGETEYEIEFSPDPDGWPTLGGDRGDVIERFTNGQFAAMLEKVAFCISREETRYYLNGVCWQKSDNGSRMIATDGHRLALCRYSPDPGDKHERIIPRKTVEIITRHMPGKDVGAFATAKENVIDLVCDDFSIRTKLIEGAFPDIDRVIPKENKHQFDVNREELLTALRQVTAFGLGARSGHAIRFHALDGKIAIDRRDHDKGRARVTMTAAWPETSPGEFGFNASYIRQLVSACDGNISIQMNDAGSPFRVMDGDETMTRVIMPMRV